MRSMSLKSRASLCLLAALQLSLPGAAAWADARLDSAAAGPAHIESHSTSSCVRVHPADCAFHRFLSAPLATGRPVVFRIRHGYRIASPLTAHVIPQAALAAGVHHSRAPPQLS
ncbi:MAG TPA: hypothetical protein VK467_06620 [Gemmatimonadales bacterium]|nr:hypothetical protein [Gemmatimonadales bacterium]